SKPDSRVGNCLTDEALIYDTKEFNQNIAAHPGQLTNPNDQCKAIVGPNSYYGWGNVLKSFADICTSMACNTGESENAFVFGTAFRGTSCGDKKWCLEGRCVSDAEAPSKDPDCVHGDSIKTFSFLEKTCAQVVAETPSQCYKSNYMTSCCESCGKAANKLKPDCPFGDRSDSCSKILTNPSLCYVEEKDCCDTCDKVSTGPEGCEYGDKIDTCVPEDCGTDEAYRDQCCDTCADYVPPISTTPPLTEPTTTTSTTTTTTQPPTTTTQPPPTTTKPPPTTTTKQTTTTEAPTPSPIVQTTTQAPTPSPTEPPTPPAASEPTTQITTTAAQPVTTATTTPTTRTTTTVLTTTATVSPYQHMCVNPSVKFGFRSCTEVGQQLYIPCHNNMFRRLCCKECGACADRQDRKCWDVQQNPGQCFYKNVKQDCCETCTKIAEKGCVEDANKFCEYFVKENPIYVCENYRSVCCQSCKPYPVNALFARSAKGNTQPTKMQTQIDSVLKKASDPNFVVDLNKEHLRDIPEAQQLEKAGIRERPKKPERKKFQSRGFLNLRRTSGNTRRPANTRGRGSGNTRIRGNIRRPRLQQGNTRRRFRAPRRNNRNRRRNVG
ncbi:mucin-5AC-like, partial [Saccostrea cucullata]|uniref:mucin-5AC-like n=1 Tax=Saccostrea cuccullata TaxID=36930 RepID=UPI002ED087A5